MKNIVLEYCKAHVLLQMLDLHRERGSLCSQLHAWPFFSVMVGMMINIDNNDDDRGLEDRGFPVLLYDDMDEDKQ